MAYPVHKVLNIIGLPLLAQTGIYL